MSTIGDSVTAGDPAEPTQLSAEEQEKRKAEDRVLRDKWARGRYGDPKPIGWKQPPESENECSEMIADWDANESVWTVEMGGLGPGYEQAIQVLAIELIRDFTSNVPETLGEWRRRMDAIVKRLDDHGFSGAQVGAAGNLAACMLRHGPKKARAMVEDKDRHIQVSRHWPKAPEAPAPVEEPPCPKKS